MTITETSDMRAKLAAKAEESAIEQHQGGAPTIADLINRQKSEIARALPRHMDADRLARIATTTIKTTPTLMECSAQSLLGALMLSAQTGLEPGPLGHVYFVPRRNKGTMECQWMLGYKGIIELARRSGKITSIEAREVCERDHFEYAYGLNEKLEHAPYMGGERGPIVAFWGKAEFVGGGHYFVVLSKADVDKAMQRSDAGKKGWGPWVTDYAAMGRKTVIRRMMPYLPLTAEEASVVVQDESVHTRITAHMADEPPAAQWVEVPGDEPMQALAAVVNSEPVAVPDPGPFADDNEVAEAVVVGEVSDDPMSEPQRKALHALLRKVHNAAGDARFPVLSSMLGREITSTNEISKDECGRLIDVLQDEDDAA